MKPSEARVKNRASVLRAGTRKAETMTPSRVRGELVRVVGRRRSYNSDRHTFSGEE